MNILQNIPLKGLTTFKIGGNAKFFCEPKSVEELQEAISFAQKKSLKFYFIGLGSNLLINDGGIDGLVVKSGLNDFKIEGNRLFVGSGYPLQDLVHISIEAGLEGLEVLAGIPGSVGGAVVQNAGQKEGTIGEYVQSVEVVDDLGNFKTLSKSDCEFGYRNTIFKKKKLFITKIELVLSNGEVESLKAKFRKILKNKLLTQPYDFPSAGSFFKNPEGDFAGRLIEAAGLKGLSIGDAEISEKHANFIINRGKASSKDVLLLAKKISDIILEKFGKKLEAEVVIL